MTTKMKKLNFIDSITNKEEYGIKTDADILHLKNKRIKLIIQITQPELDKIINLTPKERLEYQKERVSKFANKLGNKLNIEVSLTKTKKYEIPRIICVMNSRDLLKLKTLKEINFIAIEKIEGIKKIKIVEKKTLNWFAVNARFAVQIENQTKGYQSYEDRIILVKAYNHKDALKRLQKEFREYSAPYLNMYYELVRWKFEKILRIYEPLLEQFDEKGCEVYSSISNRKLKAEHQWINSKNSK
jgi:hypothetical protein